MERSEYGVIHFDHRPFVGEWVCLVPVWGEAPAFDAEVVRVQMPRSLADEGYVWLACNGSDKVLRWPFWLPLPKVVKNVEEQNDDSADG